MTQYCILKRTHGSLVPQSYLYSTCQGNSQMNELARNIPFKREFLRIWSQKTPHNYITVLVWRVLLSEEKLSSTISLCAAAEGLFPLPEKSLPSGCGIQYIPTICYCSNIICTIAVMGNRVAKNVKMHRHVTCLWPIVAVFHE